MNSSLQGVVHCFWVLPGGFYLGQVIAFLQFVYGSFNFFEGDGCIYGNQTWFLLDEVKNCVVNRSVII